MNRYEELFAPPSLGNKDFKTYVGMQSAISLELRKSCSQDLLNPKIKLTDELTTARFKRDPPGDEPPGYISAIARVTGGKGKPIAYRFFAGAYEASLAACGLSDAKDIADGDAVQMLRFILGMEDAWSLQAWAAQFLRVAQNSELQDPENSGLVWGCALSLYFRFFERAKLEESFAWLHQPDDENMKAQCADAWKNFLPELVRGLEARVAEYIKTYKVAGFRACLDALNSPEAHNVDETAYELALKESFPRILSAIEFAPNVGMAGGMYKGCPAALRKADEKLELKRAMMVAMRKEAELLQQQKGFGDAFALAHWMEVIDAKRYHHEGSSVIQGEAKVLFENCRIYILLTINSEGNKDLEPVASVLKQMPPDLWIGNQKGDGPGAQPKKLFRDDVLAFILPSRAPGMIRKDLTKGEHSEDEARGIGKTIWQEADVLSKGSPFAPVLQATVAASLTTLKELDIGAGATAAFLEPFPDHTPVLMGSLNTVGALRRALGYEKLIESFGRLKDGGEEQLKGAQSLISAARSTPSAQLREGQFAPAAQGALLKAFTGNLTAFKRDPARKTARRVLVLIAEYMPQTRMPGRGNLTLKAIVDGLDADLLIKAAADAKAGTPEEMTAVRSLIRYVYDHPGLRVEADSLEELAKKLLIQKFVDSASRCAKDRSASVSRDLLDVIADFLPEGTRLPYEGGEALAPAQLMLLADGASLLAALSGAQRGTDGELELVTRLLDLLSENPSLMDGNRYAGEAWDALAQTLIQNVNLCLEGQDGSHWEIAMLIANALPGDRLLPIDGGLTVRKLQRKLDLPRQKLRHPLAPPRVPAEAVPRTAEDGAQAGKKQRGKERSQTGPIAAQELGPRRRTPVNGIPFRGGAFAAFVQFALWSLLAFFLALCAAEYFLHASRTVYPRPAGAAGLACFLTLGALWLMGGLMSAAGKRHPFLSGCVRWHLFLAAPPMMLVTFAGFCGFSLWGDPWKTVLLLYLTAWWFAGIALARRASGPLRAQRPFAAYCLWTFFAAIHLLAMVWLLRVWLDAGVTLHWAPLPYAIGLTWLVGAVRAGRRAHG